MSTDKKCSYCGSTKNVNYNSKYCDLLCGKHGQQMNTKGYLYKSYKEPNDYIIVDDKTAYIIAYKGQFTKNADKKSYNVIVDLEDLEELLNYKWRINRDGYAHSSVLMHRLILNCNDKDLYVDHINHNRLDNRKCNLRVVTPQQNCWNSVSFKGKSKFKGVKVDNSDKRYTYYIARGCLNDNQVHIGVYKTELEAAYAYNIWVKEHFGEFANENTFTDSELEELNKMLPLKTIYEHKKQHASSKYRYVNYVKRTNKWAYERTINKVRYRKSNFLSEDEAHEAYLTKMTEIGVDP